MKPLGEVIAALRRELESGVSSSLSAPAGHAWDLERATVRLNVILREASGAGVSGKIECLVSIAGADQNQTGEGAVTLEVTLRRTGTAPDNPPAAEGPRNGSSFASEPHRREALTEVFGKPGGFYSHNRAEVFLAALAELSDADFEALRAALGRGGAEGLAGELALAFGQIANILRSGPAGSVERGASLLRMAMDGISRAGLERFVRSTWKNEGLTSA
jgi:hypothetical protein